jgi:sugar-specific transcriptional regulator TrmB
MEDHIREVLKSLGLNRSETDVYLDLVKNNASSALEISKRAGIHRPNTYDALRKLISRGFVREIIIGNKKGFQSLEPERLMEYFKERQKEIEGIVPKIKEISRGALEKDNVSLSKGMFSLRRALFTLLEQNQPIDVYSIPSKVMNTFGEAFCNLKDFHKERVKRKILIRHIYSQENPEITEKLCKMKCSEARHLGKKVDHLVNTIVCGDTVLTIIFSEPISIIEIKNKKISESYHHHFDTLWNRATVKK